MITEKLEVLQTANEYMERLIDGINQCIEYYRVGELGSANQQILLVIDGLEWVIKVIELTQDLRERPIEIIELQGILSEVVEGMKNSDITLIADLLEYEVIEQVINWKEIIESEIVA